MNKRYLIKAVVYFVLAIVVMPIIWVFSSTIIGLFITQSVENIQTVIQIARFLHIGIVVLVLTFLGLGVWNLIKLLGDEEDENKEK